MSYRVKPDWSLEALIDYLVAVYAAVNAQEELAELAPPFAELKAKARGARDRRDELRYAAIEARAVAAVRDTAWDDTVGDLSGAAYLVSGKDDQAPPYSILFGNIKADEMRRFGLAKATLCGRRLVAQLTELNHPGLTHHIAPLTQRTDRLDQAHQAREAANQAVMLFAIEQSRLIDAVQRAVDQAEVTILTRSPGNRGLVRAVLAPQTKEHTSTEDPTV